MQLTLTIIKSQLSIYVDTDGKEMLKQMQTWSSNGDVTRILLSRGAVVQVGWTDGDSFLKTKNKCF